MSLIEQVTCPDFEYIPLHPLYRGLFAIVSKVDLPLVAPYRWNATPVKTKGGPYAFAYNRLPCNRFKRNQPPREKIRMHRLILGLPNSDPRVPDHINRNTLDNRRENLRIATTAQNNRNYPTPKTNKSGQKGVRLENGYWRVRIRENGKKLHISQYKVFEDAVRAYREAALRIHGEFACLEG